MLELSPADLATYSAHQVATLADVDVAAVLREGHRRQEEEAKALAKAEKALARAQAAVAAAKCGLELSAIIIKAAHAEERRQAEAWAELRRDVAGLHREACHGAGAAARWAARDALDNLAHGHKDDYSGTGNAYLLLQAMNMSDADIDAYHAARPISR